MSDATYRLELDHTPSPFGRVVRGRKGHVCALCDDTIPAGMLHRVWTTFWPGDGPVRSRCHVLCEQAYIVETTTIGSYTYRSHDSLGIDSGEVAPDKGASDWWAIIEDNAPAAWWDLTDCGQTAHVWPPDLHGWLISLAPPRWST